MGVKYSRDTEEEDKKMNELKMKYKSLLGVSPKEATEHPDEPSRLKDKYRKLLGTGDYQMEDPEYSKRARTEDEE